MPTGAQMAHDEGLAGADDRVISMTLKVNQMRYLGTRRTPNEESAASV